MRVTGKYKQSEFLKIILNANLYQRQQSPQQRQDKLLYFYTIFMIIQNIIIKMFKFTQIAVCENSVAEQIDIQNPQNVKTIVKGQLKILLQVSNAMMLFKMGNFEYGVNPNDRIIYEDKDPHFKLVLCFTNNNSNCWILKINENVQLVQELLSERCKLINKKASKVIVRQIQQSQGVGVPKIIKEEEVVKATNNQNIGQQQRQYETDNTNVTLVEASKSLSKGLALAGQYLAKGLESLGDYLSRKIQPSKGIVITEDSKNLIKKSADSSKKVIQVSTQKFAQIFRIAKGEAGKILDQYENSNHGKKMMQNGNYNNYKNNANTGMHLIGNIVDGLVEGIVNLGAGIAKGGNKIVNAKYGKDTGQLFNEILQTNNNDTKNIKYVQSPSQVIDPNFNPTKAVIKKL